MNEFQIALLTSFLKKYKRGSVTLESIIQHIDSIVDTKKVDTIIKLQNKEYVS